MLGHSLGGLVIVQALVIGTQAQYRANNQEYLVMKSTKGLFFFGTPHLGANANRQVKVQLLQTLAKAVWVEIPPRLASLLEEHSDQLMDLTTNFRGTPIYHDPRMYVYTFHETVGTFGPNQVVCT